jgi:hypothetical protein
VSCHHTQNCIRLSIKVNSICKGNYWRRLVWILT